MKILHVIDSEGYFGAEAVLAALCRALGERGVECRVLNLNPHFDLEAALRARGFSLPCSSLPPGGLSGLAGRIVAAARAWGADALHVHGYKPAILLAALPRRKRLPVVRTMHGWTTPPGLSKMGVYAALDALAMRRCEAVVYVGRHMLRQRWLPRLDERRVRVIENGIPDPLPLAQPVPEVLSSWAGRSFVIATVGRLSEEKAQADLIDATIALHAQGRDVRLLIVGDGPLRAALEARAKPLGSSVLFAGLQDAPLEWLQRAQVFALPSLTEGLPISLLEAMALGVPVVASEVGSVAQALGGHGQLIAPGRVAQLAQALARVMDEPEAFRTQAANARERFLRDYSASVMAERYKSLYRDVLREGR